MRPSNVGPVLRRLTRGMAAESAQGESDRRLVERLLAGRDEAAFEAVVRRHGPMVYRVCWHVLRQEQDAEDAFQATFLVLAQQLRRVRRHASLASWLHGVARRVALKARAGAAARRRHERKAAVEGIPVDEVPWGEACAILDAELRPLPERWRLPLDLCYLEGRTQDEAAAQLGWSLRTLRRRLGEARAALGRRLRRRGVAWPAALVAFLFSDCMAPAGPARGLVSATVEAGAGVAAGQAITSAVVSSHVHDLTKGALKTMFIRKLAVTAALVLTALGLAAVGGVVWGPAFAGQDPGQDGVGPSHPARLPAPLPGGKAGKGKDDRDQLQGGWDALSGEMDGRALPEEEVKRVRVAVKEDSFVLLPGGEWTGLKIRLDTSKSPKVLYATPTEGPDQDKTTPILYELDREADTLKLCFDTKEGTKRPTGFATKPGSGLMLLVLKHELRAPAKAKGEGK